MLITPQLLDIISFVLLIAGFGITFYFTRNRLNQKARFVIAILAGVVLAAIPKTGGDRILVIEEDLTVKNYVVFGTYSTKLKGGKTVNSSFASHNFGVVNKSGDDLIIEEIVYQRSHANHEASRTGNFMVPAYSYQEISLPDREVSYYFDETIPEKLESSSSVESKYWLHLVGEEMVEF